MSGGHFDYLCFRISNFAEELDYELKRAKKDKDDWDYEFDKATIARLKQCQKIIAIAGNLAHEVEWLYSGDTGEDNLKNKLNSELKKLERIIKNGKKT